MMNFNQVKPSKNCGHRRSGGGIDMTAPLGTEPVCTISIRSKSKRNRAIAEFEPSLLSRISDFILKRMDEEFKGTPPTSV